MANALLRQFRTSLDVNQKKFADAAGINATYLCQVETDEKYNLGHDAGLRIFEAYRDQFVAAGISFEMLLRGESKAA